MVEGKRLFASVVQRLVNLTRTNKSKMATLNLGAGAEDVADAVERVTGAAPMLDMRVIHHRAVGSGKPGVMVVDRAFVLRVERRVGKPVNVTIRSTEAWAKRVDGFLRHVAAGSLVPIISVGEGAPSD